MKTKIYLLILLVSFLIVGCSQTPRVTLRDYEEQNVGLVAKHWRQLAIQTSDSLSEKETLIGKGPIFIASETSDSAFDKAFKDYLTYAFLSKGITVSKNANSATAVINFKAETYLYTKKGEDKSPLNKKTFWAFLYTLKNQLSNMTQGQTEVTLLSLGLLWDYLDAKNMSSDAEVVLTVSVEDFNSVRYRRSTEFYIQRNDLMLYWSDKAPYPNQLTSVDPGKSIQTKQINVFVESEKSIQTKKVNVPKR